jgi:hypothetical protein
MYFVRTFLALLVWALFANNATANDAMAVIGPTGVKFQKSHDIDMRSEDLFISKDKITVRYEFLNNSDHDIAGTVSFPLPPIYSSSPYAFDMLKKADGRYELRSNPLQFKLMVDGKNFPVQTDVREEDDCGYAACVYHVNYHWQQNFPAHKVVRVEHEYRTAYGSGVDGKTMAKDYCIDQQTMQAMRKANYLHYQEGLAKKDFEFKDSSKDDFFNYSIYFSADLVEYILQTANNWHGPIGHFKLTIDKGAPDMIMQLCWPYPLKKISPTQFVFEQDNFVPKQDLKIMLLSTKDLVKY